MPLIKSISGIRGTVGGQPGEGLTPEDMVGFTRAFALLLKRHSRSTKIVIGRDGRASGEMISRMVSGMLMAMGFDVLDLGLSTTPTVEMAVPAEKAAGGIIITASHNLREWNALKLLNKHGEFISEADGVSLMKLMEKPIEYAPAAEVGGCQSASGYLSYHIEQILALPLVNREVIRKRNFKIVVDPVNSTGAIAVPQLLHQLGVEEVTVINDTVDGRFAHNPEPLPENLTELSSRVNTLQADLGIAVDPDVDRLVFICEDGSCFGEEYTLVAAADYVLQHQPGNTVSNLSSTRALREITGKAGGEYFESAVGEVHVVEKMKSVGAIIGGEGNGGVIYPALHYGRDALAGIALVLSYLADSGLSMSALRARYPDYYISKNKVSLDPQDNLDGIFAKIRSKYQHLPLVDIDGLKIYFDDDWVHLRRSNTEPIIRIYAESHSEHTADNMARQIMADIQDALRGNA